MIPKKAILALPLAAALVGVAAARHADRGGPILHTVALGTDPTSVAVDSATGRAFVVDRNTNGYTPSGQGVVSVVDTRTGAVLRATNVGPDPREAVVDARNGRILVANDDDASVSILDARSGTLLGSTHVGYHPHTLATDTRTDRAFVANSGDGTVSVLDTRRDTVLRTVRLSSDFALSSIAVDARTGRVIVGDDASGAGLIHVLDARSGANLGAVAAGPYVAEHIAIDDSYPSGGLIVVGGGKGVSIVEARGGRLVRAIPVGGMVTAVAVDPRRRRVYAAVVNATDGVGNPAGPGRVVMLDERGGAILRTINAGVTPSALAVDETSGHVVLVDEGGSIPVPDAWSWIPEAIRQRVPFLANGARTRPVPASVSILDMNR